MCYESTDRIFLINVRIDKRKLLIQASEILGLLLHEYNFILALHLSSN